MRQVVLRTTAVLAALILVAVIGAGGSIAAAKPALITSIGQSAEAAMIKQICIQNKIPYELDALARVDALTGADKQARHSALVVAVGGSAKGLGAAGINKEQELERAVALLEAAKRLKMNIVVMHVGGEERRGDLSDAFIRAVLPYASSVVIVEGGDKDGLFEAVLKGKNVPITKVGKIRDTGLPLKKALGLS
ncbi:MAG: DUF6305 family protein [Clostridia bacterium]|nr:DUF6305 family protein [Clostridia bacterium]